jgi:GR25 family glycosyltransferase involved in LPS biosynthesis
MESPILYIVFNRPEVTEITFQKIKEIKPKKLYIVIDAARTDKKGEYLLVERVKNIVSQKNINWNCELKYLVREENYGCKKNITTAISWALEKEDRLIILEDDIVITKAFIEFANEMLEKYKNTENVAMVSANNYTPLKSLKSDYLFSNYGHIWGWATWKRVWSKFDVEVPDLEWTVANDLSDMKFVSKKEKKYYKHYFSMWLEKIKSKTENAWGPQFFFFRRQNNLLSIVPKVNLASNIGVFSSRTGIKAKKNNFYFESTENYKVLKHPKEIACDVTYEKYHFKKHILGSNFKRILLIVKKGVDIINKYNHFRKSEKQ